MSKPWNDLEGKVVLVTGASSGIGRGLCLNLAAAGCLIVAAARRIDRLKSLCDEINGMRPQPSDSADGTRSAVRSVAMELDVSGKGSEIEAAVNKAWSAFERIDVLVNNAGIRGGVYSPVDWPEEEWSNNINTNLTGLWLVSKYVCRLMRDAKQKGSVINISSIGGIVRGLPPGGSGYAASKTGVNAITKVVLRVPGEAVFELETWRGLPPFCIDRSIAPVCFIVVPIFLLLLLVHLYDVVTELYCSFVGCDPL